jgi:hypothetical protein
MNPSDEGAEIGESVAPEAQQATEQTKPVTKSFQEQLTEAAKQIGISVKDEEAAPVKDISSEPEPETPELEVEGGDPSGDNDAVSPAEESDDEESVTTPPEGVDATAEAPEAQDKATKGLLKDIAKLRERKNALTAEKTAAETKAAQLEAELAKAMAPKPTLKDPFADVMSLSQLTKLETEYRALLIDADRVPEDATEVPIGDGKTIAVEDFKAIVKDADRNLKWFLPERKAYLEARERAEAEATVPYPELKEDNAFKKEVDTIMQLVLSGEAAKRPDLRLMCARLVRGYQYEMTVAQQNGKNGDATTEKIVKSAKQKIAPTPVKSRSVPERKVASVNLEKATETFHKRKDSESALAYYNALRASQASGSRSLAPIRG